MDVLQVIQYIIQNCDKVIIKTIQNCQHHTEIFFNNNNIIDKINDIDKANDIDKTNDLIFISSFMIQLKFFIFLMQ